MCGYSRLGDVGARTADASSVHVVAAHGAGPVQAVAALAVAAATHFDENAIWAAPAGCAFCIATATVLVRDVHLTARRVATNALVIAVQILLWNRHWHRGSS